MSGIATRFAPSPNGQLHLGHALSALFSYELAQRLGGRFILRIEDIDVTRSRPDFVAQIYDDLRWLGLAWDEPVLVQSQHFPDYLKAAETLIAQGLLYPCFASRSEIGAAADASRSDPDGAPLYPGLWRGAAADVVAERVARGETPALRLDMEAAIKVAAAKLGGRPLTFTELGEGSEARTLTADPARWGDAVIVRKDVPASYHLAVVVDDARQGVTHVTRGEDLFAATDLQRLLQVLLGLPEPAYAHHHLIRWADGRKVSKSASDMSLCQLRAQGAAAAAIRQSLGFA